MWIRRPAVLRAVTGFFAAGLVFAAAIPARAETTDLQACATQYQAAKADNKLNGQAWQDFYRGLQGQDRRRRSQERSARSCGACGRSSDAQSGGGQSRGA